MSQKANNGFNLDLPENWEDQSIYIYAGPEIAGLRHDLRLVIYRFVEEETLEEFASNRAEDLVESMQGMEILKGEEKQLSNGNTVYEVVIKWIPVDGKIIFQKRVFLLIDEIGYEFSANFTKQTLKTIGLEVNRIIESFKLVAPSED